MIHLADARDIVLVLQAYVDESERTYPKTPVDCLISDLRGELEFSFGRAPSWFEERVAQFKEEVA